MGQEAVAGVGGTRLCDWWFTDEAVLIDTAGRYTTQDSDAAVDRAGWEAFLDLLKRTRAAPAAERRHRRDRPAGHRQATREARLAHAAAIRRRLKELRDRLGVRLPVYALFTKADLIAGFTEFFDDLDREKRDQVWGTTFPLEQPKPAASPDSPPRSAPWSERLDARAARPHAGRTQPGPARADRRLPGAGRQPGRAAARRSWTPPSAARGWTRRRCCAASI